MVYLNSVDKTEKKYVVLQESLTHLSSKLTLKPAKEQSRISAFIVITSHHVEAGLRTCRSLGRLCSYFCRAQCSLLVIHFFCQHKGMFEGQRSRFFWHYTKVPTSAFRTITFAEKYKKKTKATKLIPLTNQF